VLLPSTDAENALTIAERIRMNIQALGIEHTKSGVGVVTVSIGIGVMEADKLNRVDLFKHSDIALYSAKDKGRNCSYLYDEKC
jgi:diguanylate cyclase (GGDEF)-like protein